MFLNSQSSLAKVFTFCTTDSTVFWSKLCAIQFHLFVFYLLSHSPPLTVQYIISEISNGTVYLSVVRIEGDVDLAGSLEDAGGFPENCAIGRYDGTVPREVWKLVLHPDSFTNTHANSLRTGLT